MTVENEKLLKVIKDIRLTVLADNRVDADEAKELLRIAERYAPQNAHMARFAVMLKDILVDGVVDRDESKRIENYLNWLVREIVAEEPEQGVLGKIFGFNRNRADIRCEIVAGLVAFLAAFCVWVLLSFVLVSNQGLGSLHTLMLGCGLGFWWRVAFFAVVLMGLGFHVSAFFRKVSFFTDVSSVPRKMVTTIVGIAVCFVVVWLAFVSGSGVVFGAVSDADLTWRFFFSGHFIPIFLALFSLCCLISLCAVMAGGRTGLALSVAVTLSSLTLAVL